MAIVLLLYRSVGLLKEREARPDDYLYMWACLFTVINAYLSVSLAVYIHKKEDLIKKNNRQRQLENVYNTQYPFYFFTYFIEKNIKN